MLDNLCVECNYGTYQEPINGQKWHLVCDECHAIFMTYEPLPHQAEFHADPHKYKLFAGGYGSGKTTTAAMETIDHILSTPNGRTLIGAATLPQLEQTAMKEFFEIFPDELIQSYSKQKNVLITENGHTVIFRPLDEEQKARSLNLTFFWIEEANGVDFSFFIQLQTRLRNDATDFQRGILSSNPDMNWIKTEVLLKADVIYNAEEEYKRTDYDKNISVHIAPTKLNTYLPKTYFEDTARGKPDWWVARYLLGSFQNREGLVFPQHIDHIVPDFEIPEHWHRRIGGDFGLSNPTAIIGLATDPEDGTTYAYWEHEEAQKPVSYHANIINEHTKGMSYNVVKDMVGDAAGQQKTAGDLASVFDHYAEYGVYWTPSTKKLEDSIMKMFSYFELGKLKIFESCNKLLTELGQYRYPERSLDKAIKNEDLLEKPIAVNDHLIDALRYIVATLPDDPSRLINKSYNARFMVNVGTRRIKSKTPHELQTTNTSQPNRDSWLSYYAIFLPLPITTMLTNVINGGIM